MSAPFDNGEITLLEALKDAEDLLNFAGDESETTWQPGQYWIFADDKRDAKRRLERIRGAIAKAEGREP